MFFPVRTTDGGGLVFFPVRTTDGLLNLVLSGVMWRVRVPKLCGGNVML